MKLNLKLYLKTFWVSFFKSTGTPGRLTPKRFFILTLIFLLYPLYHFSIRLAYGLDQLFYPQYVDQKIEMPIFIVGNFRSGTTLLHRLLAMDPRFTGMKTWEIYVAPTITQRKLIRWLMKINRMIGNPIQKVVNRFEKALEQYSYMHKARLNEIEEDSHILFHIWSTYHLFAFFPFPELVRDFIYYDDDVPDEQKNTEMDYYREILKRHVYANNGKRFISKNPSFSPKVKTLHQKFPDAKFINLVRSPMRVIPSSVSMFSNHWQTYGEPDEQYPQSATDVMQEQAKHWYIYPRYRDLVRDPQAVIEHIYLRFGIEMTEEYRKILVEESEKAKTFKSKHKYSMQEMGLNQQAIENEFDAAMQEYNLEPKSTPSRPH